jgi:hypothetical protein
MYARDYTAAKPSSDEGIRYLGHLTEGGDGAAKNTGFVISNLRRSEGEESLSKQRSWGRPRDSSRASLRFGGSE